MTLRNSVEVQNLTVKFGKFTAVDDISFQVKKGEIFGFLGANGAGKTTTIRVLCGLLLPTSGSVSVAGLVVKRSLQAVKQRVGYMSQKFTLYQDMTVKENLDFTAALRKLPPEIFQQRKKELFDFISFSQPEDTFVKDLPGGLKQEVSLTAAMLHDPEVVFLDEPTAGVTPAARQRFWDLIRKLAGQGKTVFVTTHYMDEAENCGRIALMRAGQIIALDTPQALKNKRFPYPLYEITPEPGLGRSWLELFPDRSRLDISPYGRRYHCAVKEPGAWKKLSAAIRDKAGIRSIEPSLEDVFIHLVEGADR